MKILICLEGNVLDTKAGFAEIAGSAKKINTWIENGAEVEFVSGVSKFAEVKKMNDKLKELGLGDLKIHAKQENEKLFDLVEEIKPRILIQNAENVGAEGGRAEKFNEEEFKLTSIALEPRIGLEVLPDDFEDLKLYGQEVAPVVTSEE